MLSEAAVDSGGRGMILAHSVATSAKLAANLLMALEPLIRPAIEQLIGWQNMASHEHEENYLRELKREWFLRSR